MYNGERVMFLSEEFSEKLLNKEILGFEVKNLPDDFEDLSIALKNDNISELIKFCKCNSIKSVFYTYGYYEEDDFTIDEEAEEINLGEEVFKLMKNEIKKYNKKVEKLDFSKPNIMISYVIYQSRYIEFIISDDWIEDKEIIEADEFIEELKEKYEDKILEIENKRNELIENEKIKREKTLEGLKKEFKELIFNDANFKYCTNKDMRYRYIKELFKNEGMSKYEELFKYNDEFSVIEFSDFIEFIWREYKDISKKNK